MFAHPLPSALAKKNDKPKKPFFIENLDKTGLVPYNSIPDFRMSLENKLQEEWENHEQLAKELIRAFSRYSCIFIPETKIGLAFIDAIQNCRFLIQQVEPDWLHFKNCWENGLGEIWAKSHSNPDVFHFLILQDVNLASPECWGRPLFDVNIGVRSVLPFEETPWPSNFWALATRLPSNPPHDIGLPMNKSTFPNWGQVWGRRTTTKYSPLEKSEFYLEMDLWKDLKQEIDGLHISSTPTDQYYFDS